MKKLLAILLISVTLLSLCACAEKTDGAKTEETKQAQEEISEKETETSNEEAKEVYWATEMRDASDVSYHTKDCELIKDASPEVLPWEIVKALGMTACEKCNP